MTHTPPLDQLSDVDVARGLMAGDRATFKQGYSAENTVIAVAELRGLSSAEVLALAEQVNADVDVIRKVREISTT